MVEKKIIYIVLATLGIYLLFTEKGLNVLKGLAKNLSGNNNTTNTTNTPKNRTTVEQDVKQNGIFSGGDELKNSVLDGIKMG